MQVQLSRVEFIVVGSPSRTLFESVADYEQRLRPYVSLSVRELRSESLKQGVKAAVNADSQRVLKALSDSGVGGWHLAVCDRGGEMLSSEQLTESLLTVPRLRIVIGGAGGLSADVLRLADSTISFGRITLPHQLARVVALEQLYRAFRIARGEPYHC